jgi:hypothetical protein
MTTFHHIKAGDTVIRILGEVLPMPLKVTEVDDTLIHCGRGHSTVKPEPRSITACHGDPPAEGLLTASP